MGGKIRAKSRLIPAGELANNTEIELTTDYYIMKITKSRKTILPLAAVAGLALAAGMTQAAVVYVDADYGTNTALDGAGTFNAGDTDQGNVDDQWSERTFGAANGGSVLVAAGTEDATPRLVTTFTLPGEGQYNIYGYYYTIGSWDASFTLGSGSATTYTNSNGTNLAATTGHFTEAVVVNAGGSIDLFEASLGVWDTTVNGLTVSVYIDDPETSGGDDRTWYDGVGYEAVPEPSTTALLGLGGLALILRRRKG